MNITSHDPLQMFLQTVVADTSQLENAGSWAEIVALSERNLQCAQIFVAMVPILPVHPVLQRYFVTDLILGGVKG